MKFKIKGKDRTFWVVIIACLIIGIPFVIVFGPNIMSLFSTYASCDTSSCLVSNCNPCPSGQTAQNCFYYPKCGSTCLCSNSPTSSSCNANAFPPLVCRQCECIPTCTPQCSGKNCGSDGCGGSCGTCSTGQSCNNGICQTNCISHSSYSCSGGDVYWFDSCGNKQDIKQSCSGNGCSGNSCNSNPCNGVTCNDYCNGNTRYYNGICSGGTCQYNTEICQIGCSNAQCISDPCAGVTCPDTCSGGNREYNGHCSGGSCQYSTEACQYGCSNAQCISDPCAGVTCPDRCEGTVKKFGGNCVAGNCQYNSQDCGTAGCSNGQCINECNNDTDCQQKYSSCFMTCSNHQCVAPISAGQPPKPCSQAVWKDYPTCSWDQTKCAPPTWIYLVIIGMVAIIGIAAFYLKKVW